MQTVHIVVPPLPLLSLDYIDNIGSDRESDTPYHIFDDMVELDPEFKNEVDSEETITVVR